MPEIESIIGDKNKNWLEIYKDLYLQYISTPSENSADNLCKIALAVMKNTNDMNRELTDDEKKSVNKIRFLYFSLMQELVYSNIRKNLDENNFYEVMYNEIFNSNLFPKGEFEGSVLLFFFTNIVRGIPYYKAINPLELGKDEFSDVLVRIKDEILKASSMLDNRFQTKAEEASQLYEIAKTIEDERDRIVFWAACISEIQRIDRKKNQKE